MEHRVLADQKNGVTYQKTLVSDEKHIWSDSIPSPRLGQGAWFFVRDRVISVPQRGFSSPLRARKRPVLDGDDNNDRRRHDLSETQKETIDRAIHKILETEHQRATQILHDNKPMLEMLRDLLLEKKTLEAKTLKELVTSDTKEEGRKRARKPKEGVTKG